ncbi:MAG: hypothetical protein IT385_24450 [Deltaproteobacteria bacterium]|nr:hypothetical protein [Deltaproteobacteria bacterium]
MRRHTPWLAGALVALLASLAVPARAIPAPELLTLGPPRPVSGEHQVAREAWHIDCGRLVLIGRCESVLTMQILGGVVLEVRAGDVPPAVSIDGQAVALPQPLVDDRGEAHHRLAVPAGARTLVVRRWIAVRHEALRGFLVFPADETRHLVLHDGRVEGTYGFEVIGTPAPHRLEGYTLTIEVVTDPALVWSPVGLAHVIEAWQHDGRVRRIELGPDPSAPAGLVESGRDASALVHFEDPGEVVHFGGPMLGLGLGVAGSSEWFLARLEYEIAIADFILPGLSLDLSTRGLVLAPRVEVSTPHIALIPSFWAGIGLPIRLETDPDVGVRLMGGFQFGPVGALIGVDLRPGDDGLESEIGALIRLSL